MKFETLAVHAGQEPDPNNGAVMTPVYLTSTYMQDGVAQPRQGYEYSRTQNPTRKALQDCLAVLESGSHGFAFASGLAATDTVLRLLKAGDHVPEEIGRTELRGLGEPGVEETGAVGEP